MDRADWFWPRSAAIARDGWAGRTCEPCIVVGETRKRYWVILIARIGMVDRYKLIPKYAVKFSGVPCSGE
jgi:hypothetical protein